MIRASKVSKISNVHNDSYCAAVGGVNVDKVPSADLEADMDVEHRSCCRGYSLSECWIQKEIFLMCLEMTKQQ